MERIPPQEIHSLLLVEIYLGLEHINDKISAMTPDITMLRLSIAFKLVASKLIALSRLVSKFGEHSSLVC